MGARPRGNRRARRRAVAANGRRRARRPHRSQERAPPAAPEDALGQVHRQAPAIYLDHFAGTADSEAAAAAAGVTTHTVRAHARKHPEFEAAESEALRYAYAGLEAEAVRQRLAAQRRLSENLEPTGEVAREFERVMKLLARFDRRHGQVGRREVGRAGRQSWTFDEAIRALDKKLNALGIRRGILPPEPEDEE